MCVHVCIRGYVRVGIYSYMYMYLHTHMQIGCICMFIYLYLSLHAFIPVFVDVYVAFVPYVTDARARKWFKEAVLYCLSRTLQLQDGQANANAQGRHSCFRIGNTLVEGSR